MAEDAASSPQKMASYIWGQCASNEKMLTLRRINLMINVHVSFGGLAYGLRLVASASENPPDQALIVQ